MKDNIAPSETQKLPLSMSGTGGMMQTIKEDSLPTPLKTLPSMTGPDLRTQNSILTERQAGVGTTVSSAPRGYKRTASTLSAVSKNINSRANELSDIQEEIDEDVVVGA